MSVIGPASPDIEIKGRHLAAVRLTGALMVNVLKTSGPRVLECEGILADAQPVRMGYDVASDAVHVVYEHESFPLCYPGMVPTVIGVSYGEWHGQAAIERLSRKA